MKVKMLCVKVERFVHPEDPKIIIHKAIFQAIMDQGNGVKPGTFGAGFQVERWNEPMHFKPGQQYEIILTDAGVVLALPGKVSDAKLRGTA